MPALRAAGVGSIFGLQELSFVWLFQPIDEQVSPLRPWFQAQQCMGLLVPDIRNNTSGRRNGVDVDEIELSGEAAVFIYSGFLGKWDEKRPQEFFISRFVFCCRLNNCV